jgi:hypothetical protein
MRQLCTEGLFTLSGVNCATMSNIGTGNGRSTDDRDALIERLQFQLNGFRERISGDLSHQGTNASYWASTPNGTNAHGIGFHS